MTTLTAGSRDRSSDPPRHAEHRLPDDWEWVDTAPALDQLVECLRGAPRFALDTESNSMHAYRERICLVQVSLPDHDVLVDPLAVDLRPLGPVLADASIEKVMHGADYDILCFKREYGMSLAGLFDTMLAARVLGWRSYGLGAILAERYGFRANKKMQRFDWGQRPLPEPALHYARWDTRFLLDLRLEQLEALRRLDREDELRHACLRQTRVEPRPRKADRLGMWGLKGARQLSASGRAVLRALYELRAELAEQLDRPVFRVMSDQVLLDLARDPPEDARALDRIQGLHPRLRASGHHSVWAAIERARDAEPPVPPPIDRGPGREHAKRFDALRAWRKAIAHERGVEPDIILGREALMTVAQADPRTHEELVGCGALDSWELERYGAALLQALHAHDET